MSNALMAVYETANGMVELDAKTVREYLTNGSGRPSDQEVAMFINLCKYQGLNPFLREAYLIKYSDKAPASTVVGKDAFTRRAAAIEECEGWTAGIAAVTKNGEYVEREGTIVLPGEKLVGGWCSVKRKGWGEFKNTAALDEYDQQNSMWKSKPGTMIRKVAIVQALRECFPDKFEGMYDQSEIEAPQDLPQEKVIKLIGREQQKEIFRLADEETVRRALDTLGYKSTKEIRADEFEDFKDMLADLAANTIEVEAEEKTAAEEGFADDLEL